MRFFTRQKSLIFFVIALAVPTLFSTVHGEVAPAALEEGDDDKAEELDSPEVSKAPARTDDIIVTTIGRGSTSRDVYQPTTSLSGDQLQRSLSSSVPATLDGVPGFASQYNGPGASSPSIRGLPGDRVLMLEDGHRTGDIYWTASDHGVMVDPLSAERIEVVRGPAGLLYGANALGGVVNVIRNDIPTYRPDQIETTVGSQFESVNLGLSAGAVIRAPLGPFALFAEGTARRAGDTTTPLGVLEQTQIEAYNGALGLSYLPEWGKLGASFRYYDNTFGIPGEFNGELIPGGHPGGVTAEARRIGGRILGEIENPWAGFEHLELRSNLVSFRHEEIEGFVGDRPIVGARFEQLSNDTRIIARHDSFEGLGGTVTGALGAAFQGRLLEASGSQPGTRSGVERDFGLFIFEELRLSESPFRFQVGARYDARFVTTPDLSDIRLRTEERRVVKSVEPRSFHSVSGSLSTILDISENWLVGANLSRAVRSPTIEELYSDGPHLADFSFDIGSPDLSPEVGHGIDIFLRTDHARLETEIAIYANRIDDYIYYNPTGDTYWVFRENSEPRITPVFEAQSDNALFLGAEGRLSLELLQDLHFDATLSYTFANRIDADDPLPYIPPLSGRVALRYEGARFFGGVGARLAAPQNRVPRPIQIGDSNVFESPQSPTDGYVVGSLLAGWHFDTQSYGHTLLVQVQNVADQDYRSHLSRIKEVAPQPGRNLQVTYQAFF